MGMNGAGEVVAVLNETFVSSWWTRTMLIRRSRLGERASDLSVRALRQSRRAGPGRALGPIEGSGQTLKTGQLSPRRSLSKAGDGGLLSS